MLPAPSLRGRPSRRLRACARKETTLGKKQTLSSAVNKRHPGHPALSEGFVLFVGAVGLGQKVLAICTCRCLRPQPGRHLRQGRRCCGVRAHGVVPGSDPAVARRVSLIPGRVRATGVQIRSLFLSGRWCRGSRLGTVGLPTPVSVGSALPQWEGSEHPVGRGYSCLPWTQVRVPCPSDRSGRFVLLTLLEGTQHLRGAVGYISDEGEGKQTYRREMNWSPT